MIPKKRKLASVSTSVVLRVVRSLFGIDETFSAFFLGKESEGFNSLFYALFFLAIDRVFCFERHIIRPSSMQFLTILFLQLLSRKVASCKSC